MDKICIPKSEFQERIEKIRERMKKEHMEMNTGKKICGMFLITGRFLNAAPC